LRAHVTLNCTTPPGEQIKDQNGQGDYEQNVNQTAGDVETESQKPQDENYDEDCPKHMHDLSALWASETGIRLERTQHSY
jgi:hypothetical protein